MKSNNKIETITIHAEAAASRVDLPAAEKSAGRKDEFFLPVVTRLTFFSGRKKSCESNLVGGFNPFEKYYSSQIELFPQVGGKIKNL